MKYLILVFIKIHRNFVSKILVLLFGDGCRYSPTCSDYAYEAIGKFGILDGTRISIKRLLRCHPFAKYNTIDPVPDDI